MDHPNTLAFAINGFPSHRIPKNNFSNLKKRNMEGAAGFSKRICQFFDELANLNFT
jgi:hypothetical protein